MWQLFAPWVVGVREKLTSLPLVLKGVNPWLWVPQMQYFCMYRFHLSQTSTLWNLKARESALICYCCFLWVINCLMWVLSNFGIHIAVASQYACLLGHLLCSLDNSLPQLMWGWDSSLIVMATLIFEYSNIQFLLVCICVSVYESVLISCIRS